MTAQNYGTIGTVPKGDYDPDRQYKVGNIVTYTNGSSYLAHTIPPIGTLPTDKNYWQVSAQGGGYASLDAPGVVQPDGDTIDISNDAIISVKTATQDALGVVKGSEDISIEADGKLSINTNFEQATELVNIIANEVWSIMLGKISKSIATTMGLDENALLKSMISNQYENVSTKAASAALVNNLKQSLDTTNSNLALTTYTQNNIYTQLMTGVSISTIERVGKLVTANLNVAGNVFDANTNHIVGTLTKLKPKSQRRFALAGDGNTASGSVTVGIDGKVTIIVSDKLAYLTAALVYFTNDI